MSSPMTASDTRAGGESGSTQNPNMLMKETAQVGKKYESITGVPIRTNVTLARA